MLTKYATINSTTFNLSIHTNNDVLYFNKTQLYTLILIRACAINRPIIVVGDTLFKHFSIHDWLKSNILYYIDFDSVYCILYIIFLPGIP